MNNALVAINLLLELLAKAETVSQVIRAAQAEGRDVSAAELDMVAAGDDAARQALADAIAAAKRD